MSGIYSKIRTLFTSSNRPLPGGPKLRLVVETLEQRQLLAATPQLAIDFDSDADAHVFAAGDDIYQFVQYQDRDGTHLSSVGRIADGAPQPVEFPGDLRLWVVEEQVYVVNGQDGENFSLWKTDGTETGTTGLFVARGTKTITSPTLFNDKVYFAAGDELWISDGTEAGAALLLSANSGVEHLKIFDDKLYFTLGGGELWVSDGTAEGTARLVATGEIDSIMTELNDRLFFRTGSELWITDGTGEGTTRLFATGEEGYLNILTVFKDKLYFTVDHELWISDGTLDGTQPFRGNLRIDRDTTGLSATENKHTRGFAATKNQLFLVSEDGALWRTDGTDEGTYPLPDAIQSRYMWVVGDRVFYLTGDGRGGCGSLIGQLWVTDGTLAGTHQLTDDFLEVDLGGGRGRPDYSIAVEESLYFVVRDNDGSHRLWTSDGTKEGTERLKDVSFVPIIAADGIVYFAGDDGSTRSELWRTDGTPEGTVQVSDLHPGSRGSMDGFRPYGLASDGMLYFMATDGVHGRDLWRIPLDTPPYIERLVGDSNNDGIFDSSDLVRVFQAGKYEDDARRHTTFEEGEWNGDGVFDSSDLVAAFTAGAYRASDNQIEFDIAIEGLLHDTDLMVEHLNVERRGDFEKS